MMQLGVLLSTLFFAFDHIDILKILTMLSKIHLLLSPEYIPSHPYVGQDYKVRKFHDYSISQILREINWRETKSAKSAILTHLEALNFDFL